MGLSRKTEAIHMPSELVNKINVRLPFASIV